MSGSWIECHGGIADRLGPVLTLLSARDMAESRDEKRRLNELARIAAEERGYTLHHKLIGVKLS